MNAVFTDRGLEISDGDRIVAISKPKYRSGFQISVSENGYQFSSLVVDSEMLRWLSELIKKEIPTESAETLEHAAKINRLETLVADIYEVAPPIHLAESPSQARRLEYLYQRVRDELS